MKNDTLTPSDISAAEDDLMRDVDTLQDWIGGECQGKPGQKWICVWGDFDPSVLNNAALLSFCFDRAQKANNRAAALDELGDRYIKANSAHVLARASELADERIADQQVAA